ncbi:MAG: DUF3592 domain-containing protein [Myxococcales bacterium]|nr:DUF3592 domain-containing protein [Myxococcales bacterium]
MNSPNADERLPPMDRTALAKELDAVGRSVFWHIGIALSLCLVALGLWLALTSHAMFRLWAEARAWVEVKAVVTKVQDVPRDFNPFDIFDDVRATYTYAAPGCEEGATSPVGAIDAGVDCTRSYESQRLSLGIFHPERDLMAKTLRRMEFHRDLVFAELRAKAPRSAWVDPNDPSRATLDRTCPSYGIAVCAVLGMAFMQLGGMGAIGLFSRSADGKRVRLLMKRYPCQPWMHEVGWAIGHIQSSVPVRGLNYLLLGTLLVAVPLAFILHPDFSALVEGSLWQRLFTLALPPIGLAFITIGAILHRRWRRFSGAWLELNELPLQPGEHLHGWVHLPEVLSVGPIDVKQVLTCVETWTTDLNKGQRIHTQKLHEAERRLTLDGRGMKDFPVEFDIPQSVPCAFSLGLFDTKENHEIVWTLHVSAAIDGPNMDLNFKVPVFDTLAQRDVSDLRAPIQHGADIDDARLLTDGTKALPPKS